MLRNPLLSAFICFFLSEWPKVSAGIKQSLIFPVNNCHLEDHWAIILYKDGTQKDVASCRRGHLEGSADNCSTPILKLPTENYGWYCLTTMKDRVNCSCFQVEEKPPVTETPPSPLEKPKDLRPLWSLLAVPVILLCVAVCFWTKIKLFFNSICPCTQRESNEPGDATEQETLNGTAVDHTDPESLKNMEQRETSV